MTASALSSPTQPSRIFELSQRTALVTLDFVRTIRGVDTEAINAQVDAGELQWVWDVSSGQGHARALRFWSREIISPVATRKLTAAAVVDLLLGRGRTRWRGVELAQLLLVSRPQVCRLRQSGALKGEIISGVLYVPRPVVEHFLTSRLVFNS